MEAAGESNSSLAKKIGTSHTSIGRWLDGSSAETDKAAKAAAALNVSVQWLLTGEGDPAGPSVDEQIAGGPPGTLATMTDADLHEMIDEWWSSLKGDDNPRKRIAKVETILPYLSEIRRRAQNQLPRIVSP